jgi:hypothetical protein
MRARQRNEETESIEMECLVKLNLLNEVLIQRIQMFGRHAREYRQVQTRLEKLLSDRLNQIISNNRRQGLSPSSSNRNALTGSEYLKYLEEYLEVSSQSLEYRIQYETHLMLFEARKSLRRKV